MTRIAIFILLLVVNPMVLTGSGSAAEPDPSMGRAAYAIKDIKSGSLFTDANVEMRTIPADKLPKDAITVINVLFDRRCRDRISKGRLVSLGDIIPEDLLKWTRFDESYERQLNEKQAKAGYGVILYPIRDLSAGTLLDGITVADTEMELSKIPKGAAKSYKQIFGSVVRDGIAQGQVILESDILPTWTPTPKMKKPDISIQSLSGTPEPNVPAGFPPLPNTLDLPGSSQPMPYLYPSEKHNKIVQELSQKYHCEVGIKSRGGSPFDELRGNLNRLISSKQLENSRHPSAKRISEIEMMLADFDRLMAQTPRNGVGPSPSQFRRIHEDQIFLLGICENYKHCSSNAIDNLHCYQLESHLLRLKSEKLREPQTPKTVEDIKYLDEALEKLKHFGEGRTRWRNRKISSID